jgi:hypothetical protein
VRVAALASVPLAFWWNGLTLLQLFIVAFVTGCTAVAAWFGPLGRVRDFDLVGPDSSGGFEDGVAVVDICVHEVQGCYNADYGQRYK